MSAVQSKSYHPLVLPPPLRFEFIGEVQFQSSNFFWIHSTIQIKVITISMQIDLTIFNKIATLATAHMAVD